ncbi:MAG: metalloregulator ArsR/SmtB family transcription factor [Pseudomonadota bacterium]
MESKLAIEKLSALAHDGRLEIFRLLVRRSPLPVAAGDIAAALGVRATTLSNQLTQLEAAGLVAARREGRSVLYRARIDDLGELLTFLAAECCGGKPEACAPINNLTAGRYDARREAEMSHERVMNVLFLCTRNSARSLLAEAILNKVGAGRFKAYSAGSHPGGEMHPSAKEVLEQRDYPVDELTPKSWDEFRGEGAPAFDFVFTVCDDAANEPCPAWPGGPMSAHWGIPDPVTATGTDTERQVAFNQAFGMIHRRVSAFASLPMGALDDLTLQERLDDIGQTKPAQPFA